MAKYVVLASVLFGLTNQQVAADPVLRALAAGDLASPASLKQFATLAALHPGAAALLRKTLKDSHVPTAAIESMMTTT